MTSQVCWPLQLLFFIYFFLLLATFLLVCTNKSSHYTFTSNNTYVKFPFEVKINVLPSKVNCISCETMENNRNIVSLYCSQCDKKAFPVTCDTWLMKKKTALTWSCKQRHKIVFFLQRCLIWWHYDPAAKVLWPCETYNSRRTKGSSLLAWQKQPHLHHIEPIPVSYVIIIFEYFKRSMSILENKTFWLLAGWTLC